MFDNLKIRTKISILAGIMMIFILLIGGVGYFDLTKANKDMTMMYNDRLLTVQQLNENRAHARAIEADIYNIILHTDEPKKQEVLLQDIKKRVKIFNDNVEKYKNRKLEPFEVETIQTMDNNLALYRDQREVVLRLAMEGKREEAYEAYKTIEGVAEDFQQNLIALADYNVQAAKKLNEQNNIGYANSMKIFRSIFAVALIFSIGATWFISKAISTPVKLAIEHISEVAQYNITRDVPPAFMKRKDEIGDLAKAVQKIEENLRSLLKNIGSTADQVATSSEALTTTFHQVANTGEEVAKTIQEIAKGATDQAESTTEGAQKLIELGRFIEKDKGHIEVLTTSSNKVNDLVGQGIDIMNKLSIKTKESSDATSSVYDSIKRTNESAEKISEASSLIASIAQQTNLLALNAAIEAARAGEYGKGFAVVADEIRKLAEQSTESTIIIDDMVKNLQQDSTDAVKTMGEVEAILKEQIDSVNLTEGKYKEISHAIQKAGEAVETINEAGSMMEKKKDEVLDTIQALSAVAEENAAATQEASAAMEEQTASMEEISNSSKGLSQLSQELQLLIAKFKL